MIHVVNKHTHKPTSNDFYVGRGSSLGNPYTSIQVRETKAQYICQSKEESLTRFYEYIQIKIAEKDKIICDELNKIWKLARVGDVNLVCYCVPRSCHATIIKKIVDEKLKKHKTYKGKLIELSPNQVAICGTNTQGRHGRGFALTCVQKFGAIYGQARGLQGRTYGIVTKDLTKKTHPSRTPEEIKKEIQELYIFALENPQLAFVVPYNCEDKNLNFYSTEEMASFFASKEIPPNLIFEENFYKLVCEKVRGIS